jgi:hypothetical protein
VVAVHRLLFSNQRFAPGILPSPKLTDGFSCFIKPSPIRQKSDDFDGAKAFSVAS